MIRRPRENGEVPATSRSTRRRGRARKAAGKPSSEGDQILSVAFAPEPAASKGTATSQRSTAGRVGGHIITQLKASSNHPVLAALPSINMRAARRWNLSGTASVVDSANPPLPNFDGRVAPGAPPIRRFGACEGSAESYGDNLALGAQASTSLQWSGWPGGVVFSRRQRAHAQEGFTYFSAHHAWCRPLGRR